MKAIIAAAVAAFLCLGALTAPAANAGAAAVLATAPSGAERSTLLVEVGRRGRYRGARRHVRRGAYGYRRGRHVRRYAYRHRPRHRYYGRWRRARPYAYGFSFYLPPVVGYRYVRRGRCAWLHRRWRHTGSHYWRRRYHRCMARYYW